MKQAAGWIVRCLELDHPPPVESSDPKEVGRAFPVIDFVLPPAEIARIARHSCVTPDPLSAGDSRREAAGQDGERSVLSGLWRHSGWFREAAHLRSRQRLVKHSGAAPVA